MNAKIITLAASIFCLTVPALSLSIAPPAVAAAPAKLIGYFADSDWSIDVMPQQNSYRYVGTNIKTGKSLTLKRVKVSGTESRRVYSWNNSGTRYHVIWQPKDPDYVRLQVVQPNGEMVIDRLLSRNEGC
jgi:hypothetical protein